ncbi:hypothetical protein V2J09_011973 [Rumex salicifolius]
MVKPTVLFVPKSERDTVSEGEQMEAEEMALEAAAGGEEADSCGEDKRGAEMNQNMETAAEEDVETDDELNEAEDYQRWKAREIGRMMIKNRNREATTESMAEPAANSSKRRRFLQKYYHKGAFFQSHSDDQTSAGIADAIYTRDFSSPTGEDKMDKTTLPKVMQVKQFGRRGRTKWTHLLDQDTTVCSPSQFYTNLMLYYVGSSTLRHFVLDQNHEFFSQNSLVGHFDMYPCLRGYRVQVT